MAPILNGSIGAPSLFLEKTQRYTTDTTVPAPNLCSSTYLLSNSDACGSAKTHCAVNTGFLPPIILPACLPGGVSPDWILRSKLN